MNDFHPIALANPRISGAGIIFPKTSLDELSQFWNILFGESCFVGPLPLVDADGAKYGESFELYKSVNGGLAGLWQASGCNETTFEERGMGTVLSAGELTNGT